MLDSPNHCLLLDFSSELCILQGLCCIPTGRALSAGTFYGMLPAPHVPHVAPWHLPLHSQAQGTQNFVLGAPSFLPEGFLRPPSSEEIRNQSIPQSKYPSPHSLKWSDSDAHSWFFPEVPAGLSPTDTAVTVQLCFSAFSPLSYSPPSLPLLTRSPSKDTAYN